MSHSFSLDLLAQHKLCLDFSNPGKPPSIQWKPLAQAVSLTRPASSLSIRVNVMNGHNTLALFVIQDSEADSEQTHSEDSAKPTTPEPKREQLEAATQEGPSEAPSASTGGARTQEATSSDTWTNSPAVQAINSQELTPALTTRDFPSPSSTALNTPRLPTLSEVPQKLGAEQQPHGLFEWLPTDSENDWQRFITSMKWNELEQSHNAFPVDITQWVNSTDANVVDADGTYSAGSSEVFYGSEVCAPVPSGGEWVHNEHAETMTPPPNMRMFDTFPTPPHSVPTSSHASPRSTCDAELSDSAHPSMVPYAEASSSQAQLRSPSMDSLALEVGAPYMSDDAQSVSGQKATPRIRCKHEGCNRSFKNEYTYSVHASVHIRKKKRRFECAHCSETFSRRHDMMRHEVSQHGKVPDWTCDHCRRFFSSEMTLKNHKCPASRKVTRPPLLPPSLQHHAAEFQT
ncbi:hypothetical protein OE88DRAFT_1734869 [Heliocybe sulcata]|uniref:C2H2-type domain-containing protein n=1 Tax=Heliocybe sulcata TaxID=5364 RepID=A0A5C3N5U2_9AGAM|nr:hypothetical protein OE88DRAFT_1734869 [Heliocybe sulcata]